MHVAVVTSWAPWQEETYGRRFLDAWRKHWLKAPATLYVVSQHEIEAMPERQTFLSQTIEKERDGPVSEQHLWQAARWSNKVFAMLAGIRALRGPNQPWMLWIDADVETFRDVTPELLAPLMPDDADVTYLGRSWLYCSETGFIGFRRVPRDVGPTSPGYTVISRMVEEYASGRYKRLTKGWNDANVFDAVRESLQGDITFRDIVGPEARRTRTDHPWDHSPLAAFCRHHRGPGRKRKAFGKIVR